MKRVLTVCLGLVVLAAASLAVTDIALANNFGPNGEVASSSFTYKSLGDGFYKSAFTPAEWTINVEVTEPPPVPPAVVKDILPLKRVKVNLGRDVSFNPDPKMPVCGADKVGPPPINMSVPPQDVIARCPNSVIGNGTADLYLGHKNYGSGPNLSKAKGTAVVLVVFNGGRNAVGDAVIKIYGYSKYTTAGIYMETALQKDGTLDIAVPRLSADSTVGRFDLDIPGATPIEYNGEKVPESVGQDLNYLQAKCSTGTWTMTSELTLGYRDEDGNPIGPNTVLDAPDSAVTCEGLPGAPQYRLDVRSIGAGSGTVTTDPDAASYPAGTVVKLVATPDEDSAFSGWSGCDTADGPVCTVTVTRDRTVEVGFALVPSPLKAPMITHAPDLSTTARAATFRFVQGLGEKRPITGYSCRLDGAGFEPCLSPTTYPDLKPGRHTFEVRAVNQNGEGPMAGYVWTVVDRSVLGPLRVKSPAGRVKPGKVTIFRVTVRNLGSIPATGVRLCAKSSRSFARPRGCAILGRIGPGKAKTARIGIKIAKRAKRAGSATLTFTATANDARPRKAKVTIRIGRGYRR